MKVGLTEGAVRPPQHLAQMLANMSRHLVFVLKSERTSGSNAVVMTVHVAVLTTLNKISM